MKRERNTRQRTSRRVGLHAINTTKTNHSMLIEYEKKNHARLTIFTTLCMCEDRLPLSCPPRVMKLSIDFFFLFLAQRKPLKTTLFGRLTTGEEKTRVWSSPVLLCSSSLLRRKWEKETQSLHTKWLTRVHWWRTNPRPFALQHLSEREREKKHLADQTRRWIL